VAVLATPLATILTCAVLCCEGSDLGERVFGIKNNSLELREARVLSSTTVPVCLDGRESELGGLSQMLMSLYSHSPPYFPPTSRHKLDYQPIYRQTQSTTQVSLRLTHKHINDVMHLPPSGEKRRKEEKKATPSETRLFEFSVLRATKQ